MAQDEAWQLEKELKAERQRNLKAMKVLPPPAMAHPLPDRADKGHAMGAGKEQGAGRPEAGGPRAQETARGR